MYNKKCKLNRFCKLLHLDLQERRHYVPYSRKKRIERTGNKDDRCTRDCQKGGAGSVCNIACERGWRADSADHCRL